MKQFLVKDDDGRVRPYSAFTMDEQMNLFGELVDRIQTLESGYTTIENWFNRGFVSLESDMNNMRQRMDVAEKKVFEITECVIELSNDVHEVSEKIKLDYIGVSASFDQVRMKMAQLEGLTSMLQIYRLPPDNSLGEPVSPQNVLGVVSGLVGVLHKDRERLTNLESRLPQNEVVAERIEDINIRISDVNTRLATEITRLSLRLDALTKKLTLPNKHVTINQSSTSSPSS
jgi:predicted nuclease with TOPRIM domain